MFVLKSSISVQVSKKTFGIIKKWGGDVQISIGGLEKNLKLTSRGNVILHSRVIEGEH